MPHACTPTLHTAESVYVQNLMQLLDKNTSWTATNLDQGRRTKESNVRALVGAADTDLRPCFAKLNWTKVIYQHDLGQVGSGFDRVFLL